MEFGLNVKLSNRWGSDFSTKPAGRLNTNNMACLTLFEMTWGKMSMKHPFLYLLKGKLWYNNLPLVFSGSM